MGNVDNHFIPGLQLLQHRLEKLPDIGFVPAAGDHHRLDGRRQLQSLQAAAQAGLGRPPGVGKMAVFPIIPGRLHRQEEDQPVLFGPVPAAETHQGLLDELDQGALLFAQNVMTIHIVIGSEEG